MKQLITILSIAWIAALTVGCKHTAPIVQTRTVTDTVYTQVETVVRDTVLMAPAAKVDVELQVEAFLKESLKGFEKQFKNATLKVGRINDTIRIECACDTLAIKAQLRDRYAKEWRKTEIKDVKEVPVKYIPAWIKYLAWLGGAVCVIILGLAAIQIIKLIK